MPKTARTYRLSDEALEALENRDKLRYPRANEYIEHLILNAPLQGNTTEKNVEEEMEQIWEEMRVIKKNIKELQEIFMNKNMKRDEAELDEEYELPRI